MGTIIFTTCISAPNFTQPKIIGKRWNSIIKFNLTLPEQIILCFLMSGDSDSDDCDMPSLVSNGTEATPGSRVMDDEEDLGEEMYVDGLAAAIDLFSPKKFKTAEDCLEHCKEVHGLDLAVLKKRLSMDTFSYIRFVDYVRSESPSPGFVMSLSSAAKWGDLKFMKPVITDDPLLMFNFEEELDPQEEDDENGFEIDISRELNDELVNPRNFHNQFSNASTTSTDSCITSNVTIGEDSVMMNLDKFNDLKKQFDAMVLPNRCTIELCAIADPERYDSLVGFWSDVYGYKMSCMRLPILEEASVEVVPNQYVVSNSVNVLDLNINTCSVADTEFNSSFDLHITKDSDLTGILGYFDTFFDLSTPVMFSTGPQVKPTHWKQTVFYLPEKLPVKENQTLVCKMVCKRMKTDARALKVSLTLDEKTYRYTVD